MYWVWIIILFQIIKWMAHFWDNKALPTPTLTLPVTFLFFQLFYYFLIFIEIKCFSKWYEIWKGRGKKLKRQDRTRVESQIDCCTHLRH